MVAPIDWVSFSSLQALALRGGWIDLRTSWSSRARNMGLAGHASWCGVPLVMPLCLWLEGPPPVHTELGGGYHSVGLTNMQHPQSWGLKGLLKSLWECDYSGETRVQTSDLLITNTEAQPIASLTTPVLGKIVTCPLCPSARPVSLWLALCKKKHSSAPVSVLVQMANKT